MDESTVFARYCATAANVDLHLLINAGNVGSFDLLIREFLAGFGEEEIMLWGAELKLTGEESAVGRLYAFSAVHLLYADVIISADRVAYQMSDLIARGSLIALATDPTDPTDPAEEATAQARRKLTLVYAGGHRVTLGDGVEHRNSSQVARLYPALLQDLEATDSDAA